MLRTLAATFVLCSILACSPETMPRYATIQGLRVLGLQIQSNGGNDSEVGFNGTTFTPGSIDLTPVISDLYGGGRPLSYNLYLCLDPGVGLGAQPTCSGNASRVDLETNTPIAQVGNGDYVTPEFTGALAPITVNLNTSLTPVLPLYTARFASLSSIDRFNGISILIFYEVFPTLSSEDKITTFKRLLISNGRALNQNPVVAGLDITREDGSALLPLPTVETFLKAAVPASNLESYTVLDNSGNPQPLTETVEVAWFLTGPADIACSNDKDCTTDGFLALPRTSPGELNRFTPPKVPTPTDRGRILIGIFKDNRGGSAVRRYRQAP